MPEFVASDGVRIHYRDEGRGAPIVFLHGWAMSNRFFDRQFDQLAGRRRCIAADLRGCGRSEARAGTHTMARHAQDTHELIAALRLEAPTLVGWSMGGGITMQYIDDFGPPGLGGVALVDFPPRFVEDPAVTEKVCQRIRTDREKFIRHFLRRMFLQELSPADTQWMLEEHYRCDTETAVEMYRQLGKGSSWGQRHELPAMLAFPVQGWYASTLTEWQSIFPRSLAPRFEASRHCPFWEEPERFAQALVDLTEKPRIGTHPTRP